MRLIHKLSSILVLMLLASRLGAAEARSDRRDLVIADFEGATYPGWTATGTAFKPGPARGKLIVDLEIEGAKGTGVASSEIEGDGPQGTLTSPEFVIERDYLSFLICGGNYERHTCLNLLVDDKIVHSATGWHCDRLVTISWDVRRLAGKHGRLQIVDEASGDWGHVNVDQIVQTDRPVRLPVVTEPLYGESLRPQFHFTARQWTVDRLNPGMRQEGWVNDLNGLIYYEGEYHLFAQRWNKCWIHAVSGDLVHWQELEPAFWEEKLDSGVQSGTCVIDYLNTSGLSPDKSNPPMVAFWSRNDNQSQCLSYSLDRGRSWTMYDKNPILVHPNRDPKVFWYAPKNQWVMMLYGDDQYHVLTSPNLLDWKDERKPIPRSYECPDLFELPIDGDTSHKKWVLIQGDGKYSIGSFDGIEYKEETPRLVCDIGPHFYATQSWENTATGDGRRIQTAWMRGGVYPNMPFNQQISFPCELTLHQTQTGLRIFRKPIKEIARLHEAPDTWTNRTIHGGQTLKLEPDGRLYHLQGEVEIPDGARLTFQLCGVSLTVTANSVESGGAKESVQGKVKTIEILLDRTSVEAFVNQGEVSTSRCFLPTDSGLSVRADGGPVLLKSLTIHPLKSAWTKPALDGK